jgi:hypothetical protein
MEELRSLMAFAVCLLGEHGYGKDGGLGEGFSLAFRHTIRCVHVDDERSAAWDFVGVVDGGSSIPSTCSSTAPHRATSSASARATILAAFYP